VPVFAMVDGQLSCRYVRSVIVAGQKDIGQPLTEVLVEALDLFDQLAGASDLHLSFRMRPGDMLLVNNLTVLHGRTQFRDHEEAERRRHILRL
jgi:alpha-ketoglutarate-dependent taurine dioxygenase